MEKNKIIRWILGIAIFKQNETVPYIYAADLNRIRLFRHDEEKKLFFTIDGREYGTEAVKVLAELPEKACQHLAGFWSQNYRHLLEKSECYFVEWYNKIVNLPKEVGNEIEQKKAD